VEDELTQSIVSHAKSQITQAQNC